MAVRKPSLGARIGASVQGKVPADEALALLAAASGVYEDYLAADKLRDELAAAGIGPEQASPAESSQLLCTWVAYASVTLAQAFIDAERIDRARGGFLPAVSAGQVLVLLRDVPAWSARARRAAQEPGYDVAAELRLPVALPWIVVEPCPRAHLEAMHAAGRVMYDRVEAALSEVERLSDPLTPVLGRLRGLTVEAQVRLDYAAALFRAGRVTGHEEIESALRDGVSRCWTLGQVLARPRLAAVVPPASPRPADAARPPVPYPRRPPQNGWFEGGHSHHGDHGHH